MSHRNCLNGRRTAKLAKGALGGWHVPELAKGVAVCIALLLSAATVLADPCGMVPPIYPGNDILITRVGEQRTYAFFKDGVETFLIKPGFSGKVDEFGMLIPFPTPPAVRKVSDDVFEQIQAAIDPPEVIVDLRPPPPRAAAFGGGGGLGGAGGFGGLKFDEVRVLKQEAVGMYEVTTLEAGSARALNRWMDDHGYQYPKGMDNVCDEYVKLGWCFVAVKTKVGQKKGVDPKPGQREVNPKLPKGATFDGHVQAMGFRFKSKEFAVPMRLSAFNAGELHNIVYLLTDGPRKIQSMSDKLVVRQLPGETLYANVTQPLPMRIIGGKEKDIPEYRRKTLPKERDPAPHNGKAKELFASDLLAVSSGELALAHEEKEKELLRIGERLSLRGPEIDKLNEAALTAARDKIAQSALDGVRRMTMTVIDGEFQREILGKDNLKFASYRMPPEKNAPGVYDAKVKGPSPKKEGIRVSAMGPQGTEEGTLARRASEGEHATLPMSRLVAAGSGASPAPMAAVPIPFWQRPEVLVLTAIVVIGGFLLFWRRKKSTNTMLLLLAMLGMVAAMSAPVAAQEKQPAKKAADKSTAELLDQLSKNENAEEAVEALVQRGDKAIKELYGEAVEGTDMTRRGWAIVALSEIGGKEVDKLLSDIHSDKNQKPLVRTWAAAGRVSMATTTEELIKLSELIAELPALGRPVGLRLLERLAGGDSSPEKILQVTISVPTLQQALAPAILSLGAEKLLDVMLHAKEQQVRYQAAAYVGTLATQGDKEVAGKIAAAYKFDPESKQVPWKGAAMYVPGINWNEDKTNAKALLRNVIAWHLYCDVKGLADEQRQINNNLQSISLTQAAGYQFADGTTVGWLKAVVPALGKEEVEKILKEQGQETNDKYVAALK